MRRLAWPIVGTLVAVVLPPVLVMATGFEFWDLIILLAGLILFWALTRLSRREVGLCWGDRRSYALALAYPVAIAGILVAAAWAVGEIAVTKPAGETVKWLLLMFGNTWLGALLTEEGFFRGWLWGSLERAGVGTRGILAWTTVAFALWHLPAATLNADFAPPGPLVPLYLASVLALGAIWGLLRALSGSIVVVSFCHAVWNALTYVFFGYGQKTGDLGIEPVEIFGPERGLLGLGLNLVVLELLYWWWRRTTGAGTRRAETP